MECNLTSTEQATFIVMVTVNCGGVFLAIVSIITLLTNTSIDQSLRGILLSFSVANLTGAGMLMYDSVTLLCVGDQYSGFTVTITMNLSVTHMMILVLAEYVSLTTGRKQRARDHTGLLLISWIISVTVGSLKIVTIGVVAKIAFVVLFIIALMVLLKAFMTVVEKHARKKYLLDRYKTAFLKQGEYSRKLLKRSWRIKLLAIIVLSYNVCSIPWVVNELREIISPENVFHLSFHTSSLIIYSIHYYFLSLISIYLRYIQGRVTPDWKLRSYRYRDTML